MSTIGALEIEISSKEQSPKSAESFDLPCAKNNS